MPVSCITQISKKLNAKSTWMHVHWHVIGKHSRFAFGWESVVRAAKRSLLRAAGSAANCTCSLVRDQLGLLPKPHLNAAGHRWMSSGEDYGDQFDLYGTPPLRHSGRRRSNRRAPSAQQVCTRSLFGSDSVLCVHLPAFLGQGSEQTFNLCPLEVAPVQRLTCF